jgi:phosphotransferase system enzyme I (PtsI)
MFPFVTGVEELRAARAAVVQARETLRARGLSAPDVPIGIMIEVPSAALTIDLLAGEADFVSIGTNDLIQYTLAVDRTDDRVSAMYAPLHPAILRILRHVTRGARRRGLPVSVCGEMAADPALLPLLTGLGLREFSMTPAAIPVAKQVVRGMRISDTTRLASRALKAATSADVEKVLAESMAAVKTVTQTPVTSSVTIRSDSE